MKPGTTQEELLDELNNVIQSIDFKLLKRVKIHYSFSLFRIHLRNKRRPKLKTFLIWD